MLEYLLTLKHAEILRNFDSRYIPCNAFNMDDEGAHNFNLVYHYCRENIKNTIVRTEKGYVSTNKRYFNPPMWDIRMLASSIEITIVAAEGMWRIQFRNVEEKTKEKSPYGSNAYSKFKSTCKKYGINLDDFAIENGMEVKKEIEFPMIDTVDIELNKTYDTVHHIDLNSSHISGMVEAFPELRPPFEEIYKGRKEHAEYKAVLTHTWGYFQSKIIGAKFAHISKAGIAYTNRRMRELTKKLQDSGRRVLMWNTDGIWYQGEIYHDDTEGRELGQWKHDYTNCLFRAASKGKYEFLEEDGTYHPVVRGATKLDRIKSRDEWEWGDIYNYNAVVIDYVWTENGLTREGELL